MGSGLAIISPLNKFKRNAKGACWLIKDLLNRLIASFRGLLNPLNRLIAPFNGVFDPSLEGFGPPWRGFGPP